jgi:hypothetical protein
MNGEIFSFYYVFTLLISTSRYHLISAFGRSTIRNFCDDASAMKKLAGRDFEDLLQVRTVSLSYISLQVIVLNASAPCPASKVYSHNRARRLSSIYSSSWRHGTHWLSFACILHYPYYSSNLVPKSLVRLYNAFMITSAQDTKLTTHLRKQL